ncbi:MAG: hypothetical protein KF687_17200 [Cyclobacteriaceae bacterium]|nr:hypothetical protein [Cyclobacteriaceae bacterium]
MELRDLITTPLLLLLIYSVAYLVRPLITDDLTRRYFYPALTIRIFSALAIGFLYQFYYSGGDTFNYHSHGSRHIWEAFMDSPMLGWKLLTSNGEIISGAYKYTSKIVFFSDPASFFVVRLAAIFDLLTFSSYSATAVLFSVLSFCGAWLLFLTFYKQYPHRHKWIAIATLFIPSVVFWGSGLLKDTITLAAIGFLTYATHQLFIQRKFSIASVLLFLVSIWIIFSVKKYILMCFLPALLLWIYTRQLTMIRSLVLKILIVPVILFFLVGSGYYAVYLVGESDQRYSVDRIAVTAQITAYDIGFYSGKDAGSTYSIGELDGTFGNMIGKAPQAINVSLFRPYMWEIRNPLMALTATESILLLFFTLFVILKCRGKLIRTLNDPTILFCLIFSLTFAFAVGVSTFNFGTLARYKIPLLPFFLLALVLILDYSNNERNRPVLEATA